MLVGLLGLVGVVFVVLPLLSFVRSVQLGRELDALRRRMERLEGRLNTAEPVAPRGAARVPPPAVPVAAPSVSGESPVTTSPPIPDWAREPHLPSQVPDRRQDTQPPLRAISISRSGSAAAGCSTPG